MKATRLPQKVGEQINRSKSVTFTYNGRSVQCYEGDTVAAALLMEGRNIFGRSFKYHRPRGLFCVAGRCPNCFMEVNGQPNVKSCTMLAKDGMEVKPQNAWPSLDHDLSSIIDHFSFLLPVGFYYKKFIHPKWLWPVARKIIRRAAGYGKVNLNLQRNESEYEDEYRYVDIAIIGGGPAGLSAAAEASKSGYRILLVDDQPELGGHLRYKASSCDNSEFSGITGFEAAKTLIQQASATNIEVLNNATCFGIYEGNLVGISQGKKLIRARVKKIIIATGCFERPFSFPNNDLPGIFLREGVQRLINLHSITPGRTAVVVTNNKYGSEIAADLLDAGVKISAIAATNGSAMWGNSLKTRLNEERIQLLDGYTVVEAKGKSGVKGAVLAKVNEQGNLVPDSLKNVPCDLLVLSTGFEPANALLLQAGCEAVFDEKLGESTLSNMVPSVYAAGDVTAIHDLQVSILQGRLAGLQAEADLRKEQKRSEPISIKTNPELEQKMSQCLAEVNALTAKYRDDIHPGLTYRSPDEKEKKFVCICEDLVEKDIKVAIEEGFDDIETLKRYTTFAMGPCQGKLCSLTCTAIHAEQTGLKLSETKRTTSRPPYQPLAMGLLNGPPHRPIRLTALHHKHTSLNATLMDMGEWKRPKSYGSLEQEYRAIRERVGIIDVSTLGRFLIKGPDSGKLLEMVYTHLYSNLKVGRARYALLLSETGKVVDDGIIARIGEDEYLTTSSTGNAEFVENWLKWWQVTGSLDVTITNMTSGLAAINVAGPRARELLSHLADIDLSNEAASYMSCKKANVAGVPGIMLRIGFVGEVGWEIHFPAEYAEYLWDKLMSEGQAYDIRPVGVEAMRLLSLDKRHIWPTLDTDAASDALEADLAWAVKFEKTDFVGKHYLLKTQHDGLRQHIIGFVVKGTGAVSNGDVIVAESKPVGRVTTAGYSYAREKYVGIAWVPAKSANEHNIISIVHDGHPVEAEVVSGAFYDHEGQRMKN
jgi:sarcosine oxidase subunit alpha